MLIAQITDLHVAAAGGRSCGGIDPAVPVAAVVARLNRLDPRPDLVIATGDLVDKGSDAEYAALDDLLGPLQIPLRMLPGNHDDRDGMRRRFAARGWVPADGAHLHQTVDAGPLRLILMDSVIPGRIEGGLDDGRLDWLSDRLAEEPARPTLLALHHQPFETGMPGLDRYRCRDGDRLAAVVGRRSNILAVVCGHMHRTIAVNWAGTVAFAAPSATRQFALRMGETDPVAWTTEPPAIVLHHYRPGEGLVSVTDAVAAG